MKKITVTVLAALLIAATISTLSIVSYRALTSDSEPTPQPDRVVAVLAKCQQIRSQGSHIIGPSQPPELPDYVVDQTGSECLTGKPNISNPRLQITIRTSQGAAYQIDVPTTTKVSVGDTWPK
jgi:hypothetical protein